MPTDTEKSVVVAVPDTAAPARRRLAPLLVGAAGGYGALLVGLSAGWYTGERSRFHWFDDSGEWQQLDKAGHFWGAFHESRAAVDMLQWAGLPARQARLWGGPVGFLLQSPIEYFDGRAPAYGASLTDLAANAAGSLALMGQLALWDEVRLMPKVSLHTTGFAPQRPNVLGRSLAERLLKDYNGQTYWLAADVGAFLGPDTRWPRWLGVAVGYGAEEMVYNDDAANRALGLRPYRQLYLSPDLHLAGLRPRSKFLRRVFYVLSIVHLPAPAVEFSTRRGFRWHGFYF